MPIVYRENINFTNTLGSRAVTWSAPKLACYCHKANQCQCIVVLLANFLGSKYLTIQASVLTKKPTMAPIYEWGYFFRFSDQQSSRVVRTSVNGTQRIFFIFSCIDSLENSNETIPFYLRRFF